MRELLTAGDAMRLARGALSPAAFHWAARSRKLAVAAVTPGGLRLFEREEILRFLEERGQSVDRSNA